MNLTIYGPLRSKINATVAYQLVVEVEKDN